VQMLYSIATNDNVVVVVLLLLLMMWSSMMMSATQEEKRRALMVLKMHSHSEPRGENNKQFSYVTPLFNKVKSWL
jgi:hypothetical protein